MRTVPSVILLLVLSSGLSTAVAQSGSSQSFPANYQPASPVVYTNSLGSTYVPMDSWVYPALDRLHSLGYLDTAFLGLRPWTRLSIAHMLQATADKIDANPDDAEAREIFLALMDEFVNGQEGSYGQRKAHAEFESVYTSLRGIANTPLNDSFHLGQTIVNDYGRPYQAGFNNYTGFSGRAEAGRFSLYFRGEYQHAPSAPGYSLPMAVYLSQTVDGIPFSPVEDTIPLGPIATTNDFRIIERALLSPARPRNFVRKK